MIKLLLRVIALHCVVASLGACTSSSGPPGEGGAAGCVTDFACPNGSECDGSGCAAIAPSLLPHIQTASVLFRNYIDDPELVWRATHFDLLLGSVAVDVDRLRGLNPNVRLFDYINTRYNRYDETGVATDWALARGLDPEDFYLHYYQDVDVPTWEGVVVVNGYPAGRVPGWNPPPGPSSPPASAANRAESRAIGFNNGTSAPWYMANMANPGFRNFLADYCASVMDGSLHNYTYATGPLDGILCDNSMFYPVFNEGLLAKTHEYKDIPLTEGHPYSLAYETAYPELASRLHARSGESVDLLLNFGSVYFLTYNDAPSQRVQATTPWIWGEVWVTHNGNATPTSGSNRTITYDYDYENGVATIVRQTRAGARRVLGARDIVAGSSLGSDRGRILTLALYYLVHNRHTYYMYETISYHTSATPISSWQWNPAVQFDIGQAEPVPPGILDFDGRAGTREHYLFAQGPDPVQPSLTYRVLARRFSNALVLAKLLPAGSSVDDASITSHALGGNYAVLQADGTLGAVISQIALRNNEGAILIPLN